MHRCPSCGRPGSTGEEIRDGVLQRHHESYPQELECARAIARYLLREGGVPITADEVRAEYEELRNISAIHRDLRPWGKWAGAVFVTREFVPVGDAVSSQPSGHANRVKLWGLR